jgi:hypothetical protein
VNQQDSWVELLLRSPILQAFVGFGAFIGILMLFNDVRKRLFLPPPPEQKKEGSITQELQAIKEEYFKVQLALLQQQITNNREDITDYGKVLRDITKPIPPPDEIEGH